MYGLKSHLVQPGLLQKGLLIPLTPVYRGNHLQLFSW